jgi:hypothetical protein
VRGGHPPATEVVEVRIVTLADHWYHHLVGSRRIQLIDNSIGDAPDGGRSREHDRRFQEPQLSHLDGAGQFAGAVQHRWGGSHRPSEQRSRIVGNDRSYSGAGDRLVAVAVPDGDMPDAHPRHIGDRIVRSGLEVAELQAEFAGTGAGRRRC